MDEQFKEATGIRRYTGLMFRTWRTQPLVFKFDKPSRQPIHSYFCPKFIIKWFDDNGMIEKRIVDDWEATILPKSDKPFTKIVEIPFK